MAVTYQEAPDSPTEQWSATKVSATRKVHCNWSDRYDVANYFTSYSGRQYPFFTGSFLPLATDITIEPFDENPTEETPADPTKASYTKAMLTIQYETPNGEDQNEGDGTGNPNGITLVEEDYGSNIEVVTISNRTLKWNTSGDALPDGETPIFPMYNGEYSVVYHNMTSLPSDLFDLVGHINSGSFATAYLGITFAAKTLLYQGPSVSRTVSTAGASLYTVELRFSHKANTWEKFFDSSTDTWDTLKKSDGTSFTPFEVSDFSDIEPPS